eukprot:6612544-Pyramimonas_sp.AAC.1
MAKETVLISGRSRHGGWQVAEEDHAAAVAERDQVRRRCHTEMMLSNRDDVVTPRRGHTETMLSHQDDVVTPVQSLLPVTSVVSAPLGHMYLLPVPSGEYFGGELNFPVVDWLNKGLTRAQ